MDYPKVWQFLDDLQFFKIKLGLDSIECFLEKVDRPQSKLKFVHIAGTNGKGSTAISLHNIMAEAGYKVGMYSSPHLSSVRERFRINDNYITEKDFATHGAKIISILDGTQITYFEFATVLALLWFVEQKVDIAILEVGMGGRLDATNIITPMVTIITNVSMDHEAYLGDTLSEIAFEKAGVIKKNIPVVTGVGDDESRDVVCKRASEVAAPIHILGVDFMYIKEAENERWTYRGIFPNTEYNHLKFGLKGEHQIENAALALASVELLNKNGFTISQDVIRKGLQKTSWPGRLEYIEVDRLSRKFINNKIKTTDNSNNFPETKAKYLLDGAHNPAGVSSLIKALEEEDKYRSIIGIWGSMEDKDIQNSLLTILPLFDHIIFTKPDYDRSAKPAEIENKLPETIKTKSYCVTDVKEAVIKAENLAEKDDLICVAGSLYLIGAVREILLGELI